MHLNGVNKEENESKAKTNAEMEKGRIFQCRILLLLLVLSEKKKKKKKKLMRNTIRQKY